MGAEFDEVVRQQREIAELITRIEGNVRLLASGWTETVKYVLPVKYHDKETCNKHETECGCRVENEKRTRSLRRDSLLQQLKEFQANKDVDRNPKSERQAPRVKKPKLHPELAGFMTLDEITCDAYMVLDRIFEEVGRDRTWLSQSLSGILTGLPYQVRQFAEERPDLAREVLKATDRWVDKAKSVLRMTVSDAMFGDSVCGNCSGGLAIAWDNSSDVRCIGTPTEPPCGETYPMEEWVALYEQQRAK